MPLWGAAVERNRHKSDSQGQILALARAESKPNVFKPFKMFPILPTAAVEAKMVPYLPRSSGGEEGVAGDVECETQQQPSRTP